MFCEILYNVQLFKLSMLKTDFNHFTSKFGETVFLAFWVSLAIVKPNYLSKPNSVLYGKLVATLMLETIC